MIEAGSRLKKLFVPVLVGWTITALSALLPVPVLWGQTPDEVHAAARAGLPKRAEPAANPDLHLSLRPVRVDVDLVLVPVTVTDTFGRPVTNLGKDNFEISESGRDQQIRVFASEDSPLSIALVLDVSGSMEDKIFTEHAAVAEFFKNANPDDEYFAIAVADRPTVLADSTQSIGDIQARLASIQPGGYTALMDSIYLALHKLRSARHEKRVVLIISDGGENESRYKTREIKALAEESDVLIYAIRPVSAWMGFRSIEEKLGNHTLTTISEATGGRTISLSDSDNVPAAAAAISIELRNQYVLGFRPPSAPNQESKRKIKIRIARAGDGTRYQVHYRKEYSVASR